MQREGIWQLVARNHRPRTSDHGQMTNDELRPAAWRTALPSASVVIVGISARSAAHSARRSGLHPRAVDQFADSDLRECCPVIRIADVPAGLSAAVASLPRMPWMYTGALENHPAVIETLGESRTLWGNTADQVRAVRDPWKLAAILGRAGLRFPELWPWGLEKPPPGRWLRKPFRSGGGRRLRLLTVAGGDSESKPSTEPCWKRTRLEFPASDSADFYLQRRVAGRVFGAVYLGNGRRSRLLGVTQQLVGCGWAGARPFWYTGSVGPIVFGSEQQRQFGRLGDCLVGEFSLRGLFGVDALVNGSGVWTIEVNPRYTASVEVLERCLPMPVIRWHAVACSEGRLPREPLSPAGGCCGKAVLYARQTLVITERFGEFVRRTNQGVAFPRVADIPAEGTTIRPGQPIVSIFADGNSLADVRLRLRRRASVVQRLLGDRMP